MLFNTWTFFVFLACTLAAFYGCPQKRWQTYILIVANLFFYAYANPKLLVLLLFSALTDAFISYYVFHTRYKRLLATIGVCSELLLLIVFKYPKLIYSTLPDASAAQTTLSFLLTIPLPIGISFYCFQGISLLVDSFKGQVPFAKLSLKEHVARTLFFVSFFPHLIAGPIVKAGEFMPQVGAKYFRDIDWDVVFRNLVIGYFFKAVVADNLAGLTQALNPALFQGQSSLNLVVLLLGYSMQIFADFAGYSFIAIGLAALFGYRFPQNFNKPYISASFAEFWTRWHMSLSTFLRNYLYIPLGGNRQGKVRTYINLFLVMLLGGLWHGAAWSYAVWGLWHGVLLAIERILKDLFQKPVLPVWLARAIVFSLVSVGWLLFRLPNFSDVLAFLAAVRANVRLPIAASSIGPVVLFSLPVVIYHAAALVLRRQDLPKAPSVWPWKEPLMYGFLIFLILTTTGDAHEFIYFQF